MLITTLIMAMFIACLIVGHGEREIRRNNKEIEKLLTKLGG